jgi:hypothetical protein
MTMTTTSVDIGELSKACEAKGNLGACKCGRGLYHFAEYCLPDEIALEIAKIYWNKQRPGAIKHRLLIDAALAQTSDLRGMVAFGPDGEDF